MHGGAIGFSSRAGVGSTFAFYVKSRRSTATLTRRQSEHGAATASVSIRAQASALGNRVRDSKDASPVRVVGSEVAAADIHVLVVEDNLVNQRVLAKQLRNIGMKVAVANHGGEALEHLSTTQFCVKEEGGAVNQLSLVLMVSDMFTIYLREYTDFVQDWEMPARPISFFLRYFC
jgi:CheY-like chemotaxis protein